MSTPKPTVLSLDNKKLSKTVRDSTFAGWPCSRVDWMASGANMGLIEKEIVEVRTNEPAKHMPNLVRKLEALDLTDDQHLPFGLTQYVPKDEKKWFPIDAMDQQLMTYIPEASGMDESAYKAQLAGLGIMGTNTIDYKLNFRTKLFFGVRYLYSQGASAMHGMCKVGPIFHRCKSCKYKPEISTDVMGVEEVPGALGDTFNLFKTKVDARLNSSLVNLYLQGGAGNIGLSGHYDATHLFERPIWSVRLLHDAELRFVLGGAGQTCYSKEVPPLASIPLMRGALTVMYGFAARGPMHQVHVDRTPTASLVIRTVHPELLWKKRPREAEQVKCEYCEYKGSWAEVFEHEVQDH